MLEADAKAFDAFIKENDDKLVWVEGSVYTANGIIGA